MKKIGYFVLMILLLISCSDEKKGNVIEEKAQVYASLIQTYQKADSLRLSGTIDTLLFNNFINNAISFAEQYPEDESIPEILLNAGFSTMILAKYSKETIPDNKSIVIQYAKKGISIFDKIQKVYPDFEGVKYCYYNRGIIYDDILEDYQSADFEFRGFINKYPNDSISVNLREYIKFLGKSNEEIMAEINKNKTKN